MESRSFMGLSRDSQRFFIGVQSIRNSQSKIRNLLEGPSAAAPLPCRAAVAMVPDRDREAFEVHPSEFRQMESPSAPNRDR